MVTGGQAPPPSYAPSSRSGSGHDGWIKRLKKSTKVIVKFIEGYSRIRPLEANRNKLRGHASWVKCLCLRPSKLKKLISSYCSDLSPRKVIPVGMGLSVLCLWLPILLTCLFWLLGFSLVLTVPPATFLLALLAWLLGWILAISLLPVLYLAGWIFIIFGLPCLYLLVWVVMLTTPWLLSSLGSLSGPDLALKIPFFIIASKFYNPLELGRSLRSSVRLVAGILRRTDWWTGSLSLGDWRLTSSEGDGEAE